MVNYISLAISHAVLALAFWRLAWRADLDAEPGENEPSKTTSLKRPRGA